MKIPPENLLIDSEVTVAKVNQRYKELMKKSMAYKKKNTPHLYIIYCGGHGCSSEEKQIFLLNEEDRVKAKFAIEFKFRLLSTNYGARLCCIFDCCRVAIENQITPA